MDGRVRWKAWVRQMDGGREEKTEKGELCIGSLWRNVNMISEWLWPRCLGLVPGWSDDRWTSVTHTHTKIQGWKHISDTYAWTHTVHETMNTQTHINSEVQKHVWIQYFPLNTHTHVYIDSLAGMCDLCLLSASRAEWVNMSWLIICF